MAIQHKLDTFETYDIIKLVSYSSKSYTSVVLCDSKDTTIAEEEDSAIFQFFFCVLFFDRVE